MALLTVKKKCEKNCDAFGSIYLITCKSFVIMCAYWMVRINTLFCYHCTALLFSYS